MIIKDEQTEEEVYKVRSIRVLSTEALSVSSCRAPYSWHVGLLTNPEAPEPLWLGLLWRLHYVGMVDQVIDHWWLNQSPSLSLPRRQE